MRTAFGPKRAKRLGQRLFELKGADTLNDIPRTPPARCHELSSDRKGQLSVDLAHPYRLIFEPANEPVPRKPDGGLDWGQVTSIIILEIVDTH